MLPKTIGVIMTGIYRITRPFMRHFALSEHGFGPGKVNVVLQTPAPGAVLDKRSEETHCHRC